MEREGRNMVIKFKSQKKKKTEQKKSQGSLGYRVSEFKVNLGNLVKSCLKIKSERRAGI